MNAPLDDIPIADRIPEGTTTYRTANSFNLWAMKYAKGPRLALGVLGAEAQVVLPRTAQERRWEEDGGGETSCIRHRARGSTRRPRVGGAVAGPTVDCFKSRDGIYAIRCRMAGSIPRGKGVAGGRQCAIAARA